MAKKKTKKLHLPLWQEIVYLLLVVGGPLVTIYVAALVYNPSGKYISYLTVFILGVVALIMINFLIIRPWRIKVQAQLAQLELNYATGVGDAKATKQLWKEIQFKVFLWYALIILFAALAIYFLITGLIGWIQNIELYLRIMLLLILVGVVFKGVCYYGNPFKKPKDDTEETDTTEPKE